MTAAADPSAVRRWLRDLRRAAAWHRRLVVAGLLAATVALALEAATPDPPKGVPVLVAAHDLAGGTRLTQDDVRRRVLPPNAVPDGSLRSRAELDGRTLVAPVRAGEVLTDVRVVGRSFLEAYGDALVAVPVRIADAASVRLLRAGDVVDVLAAGAGEQATSAARVVASAVRVITLPPVTRTTFGDADLGEGALVVVVTTSETAARLAAAAVAERLSVVIRPQ